MIKLVKSYIGYYAYRTVKFYLERRRHAVQILDNFRN
jgi:hypothetical protein